MKVALFDIGGTKIKTWLYDSELPFNAQKTFEQATPASLGGEAILSLVENAIQFEKNLSAIAICTAGQINPNEGSVIYSTKNIVGYTGMQIRNRLEEKFKIPVFVENDVNAAAIGEAYYGAGRRLDNFLCLTFGTGIGGAIIINRQIFYGSSFSSGEFGHLITHKGGKKCTCDGRGCYEAYASTSALISLVLKVTGLQLTGKEIFSLLPDNAGIHHTVNRWIDEVITGLVSLIHIFNPQALILGGGIMEQEIVIQSIQDKTPQWLMPNFQRTSIRQAELGNTAGLTGMLHIAAAALKYNLKMEFVYDK